MCVLWGFGRACRRVPNPPFSATITSTSVAVGGLLIWPGWRARPFLLSLSLSHARVGSQAFCRFALLCLELSPNRGCFFRRCFPHLLQKRLVSVKHGHRMEFDGNRCLFFAFLG